MPIADRNRPDRRSIETPARHLALHRGYAEFRTAVFTSCLRGWESYPVAFSSPEYWSAPEGSARNISPAEIYACHDAGHAPMFSRFSEYSAMVAKFLGYESCNAHFRRPFDRGDISNETNE
jgi:hypothetical protein